MARLTGIVRISVYVQPEREPTVLPNVKLDTGVVKVSVDGGVNGRGEDGISSAGAGTEGGEVEGGFVGVGGSGDSAEDEGVYLGWGWDGGCGERESEESMFVILGIYEM